ncbi:MAG: flippase-like domain-containing protein [Bacteroidetes bacterium]|nr:flippase-like domain-containing protein [Bacteroidota bacterium]MCW5896508.1 flippase-like domain-containing protein [Bacteroidota bacterium]
MIDFTELWRLITVLGCTLPFVFAPGVLLHVLDVLGWRTMLATDRRTVSFTSLLNIHISSEAIARSIPFGVPFADSLRLFLLKKEKGIPARESLVGTIVRRWSLGFSQCIYVLLGVGAAFGSVSVVSSHFLHNTALGWLLIAAVSTAGVILWGILVLAGGTGIASRFHNLLKRIPIKNVSEFVNLQKEDFVTIDRSLLTIRTAGHRHLLGSSSYYFASWWMEFLETYILLHAISLNVSFQDALALEALVSALRLGAFFLPAGIGVQEAGYAGILMALGVAASPASMALFILTKRLRDACWIVLGYSLLLMKGVIPSRKVVDLYLTEV